MAFDPTGRPSKEIQPARDILVRPFSDFGRVGTSDDTDTIQRAIDASAVGGFAVGQDGDFEVNGLVIKNGSRLRCPGVGLTNIITRPASSEEQLIAMPDDVLQNVELSGFALRGVVAGQHAVRLRAIPGTATGFLQGGLWYFRFKDLEVTDFTGEGIWLDGYGNATGDPAAFRGPIQFGTFENVRVFCAAADKRALRLSGQVGQIGFDEACQFDNGPSDGTIDGTEENILIERAVNLDESLNSDMAPYSILFKGVTCQGNTRGVTIQRASSVTFLGGHFENLYEGIQNEVSAFGTIVDGVEFSNVGYRGDGSGFGVRNSGGLVIARGNRFFSSSPAVACETHYVSQFNQEIRLDGRHHDDSGIRTSGLTRSAIASTPTLDVGGFRDIWVNGPESTPIDTIDSVLGPGETITLRANGGHIVLAPGGNLDISPWRAPLRVPSDASVTLMRTDLSGVWRVIGMSGPQGHRRPLQVYVTHAMSPYAVAPGTGTVRVDAVAGDVTVKLPSKNDTAYGERISVKRVDASANAVRINGATTAENPDGQADNVVRLVAVTQAFDFERNDAQGAGGWDTIASVSAQTGAPGVGAPLTFGTHLVSSPAVSAYDGSQALTFSVNSTTTATANKIAERDASGYLFATGYRNEVVQGTTGSFAIDRAGVASPVAVALTFGTDNTGWSFAIRKNVGGVMTNLALFYDYGGLQLSAAGFSLGPVPGTSRVQFNSGASVFEFVLASGGYAPISVSSVTYNAIGVGVVSGTTYYDNSLGGVTTISKAGASWDWSVWNPAGSTAPIISIPTGTFNVQVQNDIVLNTASRGFVVSGTRRLSVSTSGVDVTGTFTVSGTANFISGVLVASTSGVSTTKPLTITTTGGVTGMDISDASGNTGLSFTPAAAGDSVFFDNRRVGSATQFRSSSSTVNDRTWLTVSAAGTPTFPFGVLFSGNIQVSGTATLSAISSSGSSSLANLTVTNIFTLGNTISSGMFPTTSGTYDIGGGANKWKDAYLSGKLDLGTTLTTGAPSGGTAVPWRFGTYVAAAVAVDTSHYVEVEVNGSLRKLAVVT
jgi:hypothetical protein